MLTPPPNVTGSLHIGHALTFSIQDAMVRWRRMHGWNVSWIPGTDHAGIATQSVVERHLSTQNIQKRDLTRHEFLQHVCKWKDAYGDRITSQLRQMGASLDWSRAFFTMDEARSKAVAEAFVRLADEGLVYRDVRPVHWCCALQTVISDIEVDYEQVEQPAMIQVGGRSVQVGVMHRITYPLEGEGSVEVETTRPETMLGDVALAVHPDDTRYTHLHGQYVRHPILNTRLPILVDAKLVDPDFGTGVVKVTPAHDPDDFSMAKRHNLPIYSILDKRGCLTEACGIVEWQGMDRFTARDTVLQRLQQVGHYHGTRSHPMRIARCSRSGDLIEPMVLPQWYIRMQGMAHTALEDVHTGKVAMYPHSFKHDWNRWLSNAQDWCVSRQLWWGHRIPAWRVNHSDQWVFARDEVEALDKARALVQQDNVTLEQDEDVLDTWFSSALLPLSALGWPNQLRDYPTQLLETGSDILFFWVARMAMLCKHLSGQHPFEAVVLHPLVRDAQGRKMSKSLGNVVDPMDIIHGTNDVPACGADALRYALIFYTQQTRHINMDMNTVVAAKHFCNKLHNVVKFALDRSPGAVPSLSVPVELGDRYILSRLSNALSTVHAGFEQHQLHKAASAMKQFLHEELCDVYVEWIKHHTNTSTLLHVLEVSLRALHPIMPYVTEELWQHVIQRIPAHHPPSIMIAPFPLRTDYTVYVDKQAEQQVGLIVEIAHAARSMRQSLGVKTTVELPCTLFIEQSDLAMDVHKVMVEHGEDVLRMSRMVTVPTITQDRHDLQGMMLQAIRADFVLGVPLAKLPQSHVLDKRKLSLHKRQAKMHDKKTKLMQDIQGLEGRMQHFGYSQVSELQRAQDRMRLDKMNKMLQDM